MSQADLSKFVEEISQNKKLQESLGVEGANIVEIAKSHGYEVSTSDLVRFQAKTTLELSDEDLEAAAGGITPVLTTPFYTATPALIGGVAGGAAIGGAAAATATVCGG